jgi:hemolysin-activating ACP:hemolysin acyltransferase
MQLKNRFIANAGVTIVLAVISAKLVNMAITVSVVRLLAIIESNNTRIFIGSLNHPIIKIILAFIHNMIRIFKIL